MSATVTDVNSFTVVNKMQMNSDAGRIHLSARNAVYWVGVPVLVAHDALFVLPPAVYAFALL